MQKTLCRIIMPMPRWHFFYSSKLYRIYRNIQICHMIDHCLKRSMRPLVFGLSVPKIWSNRPRFFCCYLPPILVNMSPSLVSPSRRFCFSFSFYISYIFVCIYIIQNLQLRIVITINENR